MEELSAPTLITQTEQLEDLVARMLKEPVVAVDTESDSLFSFKEKVCLIQFSIPGEDFLVDPLALKDISALGPVFSDENIEKVFHAAEYDLLTMKRDYGFVFHNIFDTMLAARIVGRERVGLGSMLESEFDIKLEKKYQKADWGIRPLPKGMRAYARMDTHYLIKLSEKMKVALKETRREEIAAEDFLRISQVNGDMPAVQTVNIWRMNGAYDLTPQQAAILKRLAEYRQKIAKSLDVPLFKVIGNKALVAVAAVEAQTINDLGQIVILSGRHIDRHGRELIKAVAAGLKDEPIKRPIKKRLPDDVHNRLEDLKQWRKETARGIGVESDVVLPKNVMIDLAHQNPNGSGDLLAVMESVPYRRNKYGAAILSVLKRG